MYRSAVFGRVRPGHGRTRTSYNARVERHTRYLELRLAQCEARPGLHQHQIPVLRELIALASSGVTPAEYNRRAHHLFGLTRAELLDRYDNQQRVFEALGDERMVRATKLSRTSADATNFAELGTFMARALGQASAVQLAATTAVDSLAPLVISLLHWATEGEPRKRAALAETIKGLWRAMQHNDPGCSWQRVCTYPPYRNRLPFRADGLALIGGWLNEAVGTQLADVPVADPYDPGPLPTIETPDDPPLPSVAEVARGYHLAYDAAKDRDLPKVLAVYERIFEHEAQATCANDFLCRITADDLVCELSRAHHEHVAADALAHCAGLSQPHVELHYTSLRAALADSTTTTDIEFQLARHEACFAIESAWNHLLISFAFRTITTVMAFELNPSDAQRTTIRNSYAVTSQLFGSWEDTFAIPRVWDLFTRVFHRHGQQLVEPPPLDGIYRGEVGLDMLAAFRDHALQHVIEFVSAQGLEATEDLDAEVERLVNSRRFAAPEDMRDHLSALFAAAMTGENTDVSAQNPAPPGVILWGQDVLFEALEGALSSPPRPC